jgi:hypothetical protein
MFFGFLSRLLFYAHRGAINHGGDLGIVVVLSWMTRRSQLRRADRRDDFP